MIARRSSVRVQRQLKHRWSAVLVVAFAASAVAGLPARAQKLPKDMGAYIAEADKLCAATNVKLLQSAKQIETEKARSTRSGRLKKINIAKPKQVALFVTETALPALAQLSSQLRAIPSPRGDEKTVESLMSGFDAGLAVLKKDPLASVRNDPLKSSAKEFAAVRFGDIKFTACGKHISRDQPKK